MFAFVVNDVSNIYPICTQAITRNVVYFLTYDNSFSQVNDCFMCCLSFKSNEYFLIVGSIKH